MTAAVNTETRPPSLFRGSSLLMGFVGYLCVCLVLLMWLRSRSVAGDDASGMQILYVRLATAGLVLFVVTVLAATWRNRGIALVGDSARGAGERSIGKALIRHSSLLWVIGVALCIYAGDRVTPVAFEIPMAYVAVVFVSLRSRQELHVWGAAGISTALIFLALMQATWDGDMWVILANRTLEIFIIWSAALLGLRRERAVRGRKSALLETRTVRHEHVELQGVLARNEAAGADLDDYRKLLETVAAMTRVGGWTLDVATMKPRWSLEVYRIHEVDPADTPSLEHAFSFYPGDTRALVEQALQALLSAGTAFDLNVPFVTALGNKRWVRTIGKAERAPDGKVVRAWGALQDVTEQYQAQRRLARTSQSGSEGHWEIDFASGMVWTSAGLEQLLGFAATDSSMPISGIRARMHPDDVVPDRAAFELHVANGTPYDVRLRLRTADMGWRWFRLRGQVERNSIGKPRRFGGVVSDVHTEQLTRQELLLVQGRLERATLGTQDGLWELTLPQNKLWTAQQFRDMLGYSREDLNEDVFRRLVHPDDAALLQPLLEQHRDLPPLLDIEVRLRKADGAYCWFRIRAISARDSRDRLVTMSGSIQDISLHKQSEKALIDAREAETAANRSKSGFLTNMSHEIRTPMNGVLGMTELLLASHLAPEQRHFAETVRSSARSLLSIINDILDLSKIEAGKLEVRPVRVELRQCVDDIAIALSTQAKAQNCELSMDVSADVPGFLLLDPDRLRQVLLNLCGNAIKFTAGGNVAVEVALSSSQHNSCVLRFSVRDSGIGMTPEVVGRLFQPFAQADAETTRVYGGTGLGLSIVQQLVRLMGGEVSVASSPGQGSEFCFTLPCGVSASGFPGRSPQAGVLVQGNGVRQPGRRARILVAEDNPVNQQITRRFIQMQGLDIVLVADGGKAVEAFAEQSFDLVLMDVQMPVMDGLAATRAIRAGETVGSHVPIVALTASAMTDEVQDCLAAGMDEVLTKPLELEPFRATLSRYGLKCDDEDRQAMPGDATVAGAPERGSIAVLDFFALRTMLDNDEQVVDEFCQMLVSSSQEIVADMELALIRFDRSALRRLSHKLKGASSSMHAHNCWLAASRLEAAAGGANRDELKMLVNDVTVAAEACSDLIGHNLNSLARVV